MPRAQVAEGPGAAVHALVGVVEADAAANDFAPLMAVMRVEVCPPY